MKALLTHRDRDFDPQRGLPWNETVLTQDLELNTLLQTMAAGDKFLFDVARAAVLSGFQNDVDTVLYRQEVVKDCLSNPELARGLYDLTVEATDNTKRMWWDLSSHYPESVLFGAVSLLDSLLHMLRKLRKIAEDADGRVHSEAFTTLMAMIKSELGDEYLATIEQYLTELKFRDGTLLSASLGENNEGTNYMLSKPPKRESSWLKRVLAKAPPGYTFRLNPRDEGGARIVSDMRHHGISRVAITIAQSADHVLGFFKMLRTELAFYIGCLNLHYKLAAKGEPVCFPVPAEAGERKHRFGGLYDVCLSLHMEDRLVGNAADANGKSLTIVTGANQGGKSSFLRSIGLAQIMMQCGMFVGAESFQAELCPALFTHYKREEDATMKSGKLDEELARMSAIADHITPNSILLLNESFAATNEREGSEIATQIVRALLERRVKILFVTHLYGFARGFYDDNDEAAFFWRAERKDDGTRTFKLLEGEPLETSYGEDLYRQIFGGPGEFQVRESIDRSSVSAD
jgi:DNA mismatch repair ATPase MutS